LDSSKILILSKVKLRNPINKMEFSYTLVAEQEADLKAGKISVNSPIGNGLLGRTVGETVVIEIPNGTMQLEILDITR
jgi:transcription elongation factor GreA